MGWHNLGVQEGTYLQIATAVILVTLETALSTETDRFQLIGGFPSGGDVTFTLNHWYNEMLQSQDHWSTYVYAQRQGKIRA